MNGYGDLAVLGRLILKATKARLQTLLKELAPLGELEDIYILLKTETCLNGQHLKVTTKEWRRNMAEDKEFVDGLYIKDSKAEFVIAAIGINRKQLGNYLRKSEKEWINVDIKRNKEGVIYAEVNNWTPEKEKEPKPEPKPEPKKEEEDFDDEIPF